MKILAGFFKAIFWILIITGVVSGTALGVYLYELSKTLPQILKMSSTNVMTFYPPSFTTAKEIKFMNCLFNEEL